MGHMGSEAPRNHHGQARFCLFTHRHLGKVWFVYQRKTFFSKRHLRDHGLVSLGKRTSACCLNRARPPGRNHLHSRVSLRFLGSP